MAVYTKTGDKGKTSLVGGTRVSKTDYRLEAYGSVDELSAFVANLRDYITSDKMLCETMAIEAGEILTYLSLLMNISGRLASEEEIMPQIPGVDDEDIDNIEKSMDRISAQLEPIKRFTLPGGHIIISTAHIARTVCRRAERAALRVEESGVKVDRASLLFLNRLSDYLYLITRLLTLKLGVKELYWEGKNR